MQLCCCARLRAETNASAAGTHAHEHNTKHHAGAAQAFNDLYELDTSSADQYKWRQVACAAPGPAPRSRHVAVAVSAAASPPPPWPS